METSTSIGYENVKKNININFLGHEAKKDCELEMSFVKAVPGNGVREEIEDCTWIQGKKKQTHSRLNVDSKKHGILQGSSSWR